MDEELYEKVSRRIIKEVQDHASPSLETKKFMEEVKKVNDNQCLNIALMQKDIQYLKDKAVENEKNNSTEDDQIKEMVASISVQITNLDGKFAGKWVEPTLKWFAVGMVAGLFGIIGYFIDKFIIQ